MGRRQRLAWLAILMTVLAAPARADMRLTLFTVGSHGSNYDFVAAGAAADVGLTRWLAGVTRATENRLYTKTPGVLPLDPSSGAAKDHRFARFQGGLRFTLPFRFELQALGGQDAWGSKARSGEASLSWKPNLLSRHPWLLSISAAIDDRTHVLSHGGQASLGIGRSLSMLWFATGSAQMFSGRSISRVTNRVGGGITALAGSGGWGFEASGGGGPYGSYAELSLFQNFGF